MALEKEEQKELIPKTTAKTQSKIRWSWVLAGILLLLFGLILPYLATYYYAKYANHPDTAEPAIPRAPTAQSRISSKKYFRNSEQINRDSNFLQNSDSSVSAQTKNEEEFKKVIYQKAVQNYDNNPTFNLLAFRVAGNKTENNSESVKPGPTVTPKSTEPSTDKKKRNVFEKIYDWFTGLFKKKKKPVPNLPAQINSLSFSKKIITLPCPPETKPKSDSCSDDTSIEVTTAAADPENDAFTYNYTVSGGRIVGQGANVTWDLSGARPGTYTITAGVDAAQGTSGKTVTETISVENCNCQRECSCPILSITGPDQPLSQNELMMFTANVSGGDQDAITYNWSVSQGTIANGQGTPVISVDTSGLPDSSQVTATVNISVIGCDECNTSASAAGLIASRASLVGDGNGTISGRVILDYLDFGGNPVKITITNRRTGISSSVTVSNYGSYTTDNEGYFKFNQLEPGNYTLTASSYGYYPDSKIVILSNLTPEKTVNFILVTDPGIPRPGSALSSRNPNISENINTKSANINSNININANSNFNGNTNTNTSANSNITNNSNTTANVNQANNINQANKEGTDKITFDYPVYFLKDTEHTVNLKLDYVEGRVITTTTTTNTGGVVTNATTTSTNIPQAPQNYEIYLEAALVPLENLQEPKISKGGWQKYVKEFNRKDTPSWQWKLNLDKAAEDSDKVSYKLRLNYGFKLKNSPENSPVINQANAWESDLAGEVGLPFWVWLLTYLSLPGGALMSALGVLKRKLIEGNPELMIVEDEVQCTLYAPPEAKVGNDFLVQVFAHLQQQAEGLAEIAKMTDESLKKQAVRNLDKPIKRGSTLTFQLSMSDVEIDEPIQNYIWNGNVIEVPFIISIPENEEPGVKFGKIIVSENNIPIGRLTFKVGITGDIKPLKVEDKILSQENFKRYQKAFISYASEDRPEVLERVQMLAASKIEYFQDVLSLNPGERWEKSLYKYIDQSDVVFLFWSKAASESQWVEKEILYALARQQGNETSPPDIIPIIIEGPPPVKPPAALGFLHFNDKFIYFIYAAEAEHEIIRKAD